MGTLSFNKDVYSKLATAGHKSKARQRKLRLAPAWRASFKVSTFTVSVPFSLWLMSGQRGTGAVKGPEVLWPFLLQRVRQRK